MEVGAVVVADSAAAARRAGGRRMNFARTWRHLLATTWGLRRVFNSQVLDAIEGAIRETEQTHGGEIQFAIENELDFGSLWNGVTPRQRAIEAFARLGVWDTELNNGVLIYVLWADRDVEIIADRGLAASVTEAEWQTICQDMEKLFAAAQPQQAVVEGIRSIGRLIARQFPVADRNERPDRPVFL